MTCKYCIHFDVCANAYGEVEAETEIKNINGKSCYYFKDKSKYIELPDIKENQAMYLVYIDKIKCLNFQGYSIKKGILSVHLYRNGFNWWCDVNEIGKTVFLTKEEAEAKLKRLKG